MIEIMHQLDIRDPWELLDALEIVRVPEHDHTRYPTAMKIEVTVLYFVLPALGYQYQSVVA